MVTCVVDTEFCDSRGGVEDAEPVLNGSPVVYISSVPQDDKIPLGQLVFHFWCWYAAFLSITFPCRIAIATSKDMVP